MVIAGRKTGNIETVLSQRLPVVCLAAAVRSDRDRNRCDIEVTVNDVHGNGAEVGIGRVEIRCFQTHAVIADVRTGGDGIAAESQIGFGEQRAADVAHDIAGNVLFAAVVGNGRAVTGNIKSDIERRDLKVTVCSRHIIVADDSRAVDRDIVNSCNDVALIADIRDRAVLSHIDRERMRVI